MKIVSSTFSCPGSSRENQDTVMEAFEFPGGVALAIADGIGGKPGGDVASRLAIATFKERLRATPQADVFEHFGHIRSVLSAEGFKHPQLSQMGTTLSVCIVRAAEATVGHVGDTRIYHLRDNGIVDRTRDQTEVQLLIDEGVLTKARAKRYKRRNVLTSALGASSKMEVFKSSFAVEAGDRLIFVSDGVYEVVLRREIRDLSLLSSTPEALACSLRSTVESRGPKDDYSAVCADIVEV